jgi:glycosyltransferase involved in cell wall biosynthesis
LVVLEAFAAGVPVIGSDLGGIAEWVTHEQDGLLVPEATGHAWRKALQRVASEPELLPRLRRAIQPPRSMREVAKEVHRIYLEVRVA